MVTGELESIGWMPEVAARFDSLAGPDDYPARIARVDRISCEAFTAAGPVTAVPSPRLADQLEGATLPAVGDWVALTDAEDTTAPVIVGILERTSSISRRDPSDIAVEQVLATNVNDVFVVHGMDHEPNLRRIERSLALAFDSGATPVVILSKADLADDPTDWARQASQAAVGVEVIVSSTVTGQGFKAMADHAGPSRTIALLGASGVGKSTIVNRLAGEEVMATAEVRDTDAKGRHTTVTRELIRLPAGGVVLDTPGLRGLGLWDAEMGVDLAFPDVVELTERCRFRDCRHDKEPGCEVKSAIAGGRLPARRLESYRKLVDELVSLTRAQEDQEREKAEGRPGRGRTGRRASGRRRRRR
jgi:ribosome biogenesis GTPase